MTTGTEMARFTKALSGGKYVASVTDDTFELRLKYSAFTQTSRVLAHVPTAITLLIPFVILTPQLLSDLVEIPVGTNAWDAALNRILFGAIPFLICEILWLRVRWLAPHPTLWRPLVVIKLIRVGEHEATYRSGTQPAYSIHVDFRGVAELALPIIIIIAEDPASDYAAEDEREVDVSIGGSFGLIHLFHAREDEASEFANTLGNVLRIPIQRSREPCFNHHPYGVLKQRWANGVCLVPLAFCGPLYFATAIWPLLFGSSRLFVAILAAIVTACVRITIAHQYRKSLGKAILDEFT